MGDLFSELSSGSVKKNIRFNATNTKVKQDRLQTPEEIIKERRRIHHNTYTLQQWRSRRNEMKKEEEEMLKQIAKDYEAMPTPITTPRQVDTLFLKENLLDIIDRSGKIGKNPWWMTGLHNMSFESMNRYLFYCPLHLIACASLERGYNIHMQEQDLVLDFIKGRHDEIKENFNIDQCIYYTSVYGHSLLYFPKPGTYFEELNNEWNKIKGTNFCNAIFYSVISNIARGTFVPGCVNIPFRCYLVADTLYDGLGGGRYLSNFGNPPGINYRRNLLNKMSRHIRKRDRDYKRLNAIPIFAGYNCKLVRVQSNSIPIKRNVKSNNMEYEYYVVPGTYYQGPGGLFHDTDFYHLTQMFDFEVYDYNNFMHFKKKPNETIECKKNRNRMFVRTSDNERDTYFERYTAKQGDIYDKFIKNMGDELFENSETLGTTVVENEISDGESVE